MPANLIIKIHACNRFLPGLYTYLVPINIKIVSIYHIWSPTLLILYAYLVLNETVIAGIFVRFHDWYCKYIWSPYKIYKKDAEQFLMMILASLFKLDACDFLNFLHRLN